jgi:Spy/CpxP family protein refolding chaperone
MRRRYLWIGAVVVVLALGASVVHARGHRGGNHHFAGPRFEELDLTQMQKNQLKSARTESHKKMIQLKADIQLAHVELKELLSQKNPNQKSVERAVTKVSAAQSKMMTNRVQQKLALNKILTQEQFDKLEAMPKGPRGGHRGFRGRRGGPPGRDRDLGMGKGMGSDRPEQLEQNRSRI